MTTNNKFPNNKYQKVLDIVYKEIVQVDVSECTSEFKQQVHKALEKILNLYEIEKTKPMFNTKF